MCSRVGVFTGVAIRRTIAAKRDAALLTDAQMHPLRSDLHALRAFAIIGLLDRRDRVEMRAASVGHEIFSQSLGRSKTSIRRT